MNMHHDETEHPLMNNNIFDSSNGVRTRSYRLGRHLFQRVFAAFAVLALFALSLAGCGSSGEKVVKVALRAPYKIIYDALNQELAARGDKIKVVTSTYDTSTDTSQLLVDHDVDIAATIHSAALKAAQKKNPPFNDVVRLGYIHMQGSSLYSHKYKSVAAIPDGATISIPSDTSNQARALYNLQTMGLIKVDMTVPYPTPRNITSNPKNLKFKEITTQLQVRTLDDVDAGFVLTTQAYDAKLDLKSALWGESTDFKKHPEQRQYIIMFTVLKENLNNPTYKKVVDAYHSPRVYKAYVKEYGNALVPVDNQGNAVDLKQYA
jgi:D-methionine transport system substrate-binding protein